MNKIFYSFSVIFFLACATARAEKPLILDLETESLNVWPHIYLFVDSTHQLSIDEIRNSPDITFAQPPNHRSGYPITRDAYWLKFDVINKAPTSTIWLFEFNFPTLNQIEVFATINDSIVARKFTGIDYMDGQADFNFRNPAFSFPLLQDTQYTIYVKVISESAMLLPLHVYSAEGFFNHDKEERNILFLLLGILLSTLIFNLTLYFTTRENMYIFLSVSLMFAGLHFLFVYGLMNELQIILNTYWHTRLRMATYLLATIFIFLFGMHYIKSKANAPKAHKLIKLAIILSSTLAVMSVLPFVPFLWVNSLTGSIYLFITATFLIVSINALKNGQRSATYLLIGACVFLFGSVFYFLMLNGVIEYNFTVQHSTLINFTVFGLLLTIGLTETVASKEHELKLESSYNRLLREVNRRKAAEKQLNVHKSNLEEMVQERTAELQLSESKYKQLVESISDWIWQMDSNGTFMFSSNGVKEVTGYDEHEITGKNLSRFLDKKQFDELVMQLKSNLKAKVTTLKFEVSFKTKEGNIRTLDTQLTPVIDNEVGIVGFRGISRNITDQKIVERKILRAILETEEKERNRIAIELHDGLGATLSGINMYLNTVLSETLPNEQRLKLLQKAQELISNVAGSVREIARDIRPYELTEFGLVASMESLCERIENAGTMQISLKSDKLQIQVNPDTELVLFRVLSELINNTIKHAEASKISITLFNYDEIVYVIYHDNGKGFDYEEQVSQKKVGMGLQNIVTRLKSVNGKCDFISSPGYGLSVFMELRQDLLVN